MIDDEIRKLQQQRLQNIFEHRAEVLLEDFEWDNLSDAQKKANEITKDLLELIKENNKEPPLYKYLVVCEVYENVDDLYGPSSSTVVTINDRKTKDFHHYIIIKKLKPETIEEISFSFRLWGVEI